jgi:ADP-ribose pyrophosphatase YjhB (NUDIX family)
MESSRMKLSNPLVNAEDLKDHTGVGAIIKNDKSKVLMFHHLKYDFWTIPIGKCNEGEFPWTILQKEIKEELDLNLCLRDFDEIGSFNKTYSRGEGIKTNINQILYKIRFRVRPEMIKNMEPHKHDKMEWMSLEKIASKYKNISDMTRFMLLMEL